MAATLETQALLRAVQQLDDEGGLSDMEIEDVRAALEGGRAALVDLLAFPPRRAEDRATVRGMRVDVRGQPLSLGALDVDNALTLRCATRRGRAPPRDPSPASLPPRGPGPVPPRARAVPFSFPAALAFQTSPPPLTHRARDPRASPTARLRPPLRRPPSPTAPRPPPPASSTSDAFDLNEISAVELLVAAVERGAPPEDCVRAAAGIYLRDRRSVVEALLRLLRSRSEPEDHPFAAVAASPRGATLKRDVDAFVAGLLRSRRTPPPPPQTRPRRRVSSRASPTSSPRPRPEPPRPSRRTSSRRRAGGP